MKEYRDVIIAIVVAVAMICSSISYNATIKIATINKGCQCIVVNDVNNIVICNLQIK